MNNTAICLHVSHLRNMIFELFILIMWAVVIAFFDGVRAWHDWAVGIVMGGCAVSLFYRLRSKKGGRFFNVR